MAHSDIMGEGEAVLGKAGRKADQLREKASDMTRNLRETGESVVETAQEKFGELKESASEYLRQGKDKARELGGDVEDFVREQPVKSLLIAAAVGLVLGVLWKRR